MHVDKSIEVLLCRGGGSGKVLGLKLGVVWE
jgi:hypothetical protein